MSSSFFDWLNNINSEKEDALSNGSLDPSQYNSFMINRGLSLHQDTIFYAQEMNLRGDIPWEAQYRFLHSIVPKRKRFSKWPKSGAFGITDKALFEVLQTKYKYSLEKSIEIGKLLTEDQKKELIAAYTVPEVKKTKKNVRNTE